MDYDVVIIGGGPSGLSTALHPQRIAPHLATRILILEKEHYPRFKLCAGGLTIDAEILLERLGLDVNEVPHVTADNIHFDFAGKGLNIRMRGRHTLRVIRRDEFDNWLAEKAKSRGLEIKEGISVKNIIPDENGVGIETDQGIFRSQVVVGADGSNGITRRTIFPNATVNTARVLEIITPLNGGSAPVGSKHNSDHAYFEFSPVPDNIASYEWDFPTQINGEAMRCWGIYDTNLLAGEKRPQLKETLAKEMSRFGFDLNDYEIKGHPIRWFSPENQMSAPRVLLIARSAPGTAARKASVKRLPSGESVGL
jgi:flavin-dependent dehydrogenase